MANIEFTGQLNFPKKKITNEIIELVQGRLEYIRQEKIKILDDIKNFQQRYNKSNDDFLKDFQSGTIDDHEDFFIWKSSIQILEDLNEEEKMLKELL
ncbi:MAG: hypothetical protein ACTSXK_13865 [Promethearchaeota archaeon]